jgi:hypothetical protein
VCQMHLKPAIIISSAFCTSCPLTPCHVQSSQLFFMISFWLLYFLGSHPFLSFFVSSGCPSMQGYCQERWRRQRCSSGDPGGRPTFISPSDGCLTSNSGGLEGAGVFCARTLVASRFAVSVCDLMSAITTSLITSEMPPSILTSLLERPLALGPVQ